LDTTISVAVSLLFFGWGLLCVAYSTLFAYRSHHLICSMLPLITIGSVCVCRLLNLKFRLKGTRRAKLEFIRKEAKFVPLFLTLLAWAALFPAAILFWSSR
jgi:hypothetical protein